MESFSVSGLFVLGGGLMLPVPTLAELANFIGKASNSLPANASQLLRQATLLMSIRTCLQSPPPEPDKAELLKLGILEMAEDLLLKFPYKEILAKPFSSETIMSYSYSRAARRAQEGEKTGLMWFDLAVSELSACDSSLSSGAIAIFEREGLSSDGYGRLQVLGPSGLEDPYSDRTNADPGGRRR